MTRAWRGNNFKGGRWEAGNKEKKDTTTSDIRRLQHELQKGEISILGTISKRIAHKPCVCWNGRGLLYAHGEDRDRNKKAECTPAPGAASPGSLREGFASS